MLKLSRSLSRAVVLTLFAAVLVPVQATAAPFLLTPPAESQLETWLGLGDLTFTNIFEKVVGCAVGCSSLTSTTAADFHAAVDGQGATFTLFESVMPGTSTPLIIGGYNPQSWSSSGAFNLTATDAERTAFIYNLTTGLRQNQRSTTDTAYFAGSFDFGQYQTFNGAPSWLGKLLGPTFGAPSPYFPSDSDVGHGFDLFVDSDLANGGYYQNSYGDGSPCGFGGMNVNGTAFLRAPCPTAINVARDFRVGALEVYTFTAASQGLVAPVPEPASLLLLCTGLTGVAVRRRFQRIL